MGRVTVCITGDIDYFEIETIEECLEPYFAVMEKYQVRITMAITAKAVKDYPDRARFVLGTGCEIANHGDIHQPFLGSVDEQVIRLKKSQEIFEDVLGITPVGFRAPWLQHDKNTYIAVKETGFLYDSSQSRDEFPYKIPFKSPLFPGKFLWSLRVYPLIKPFLQPILTRYYSPAEPFYLGNKLVELPITGPDDSYCISPKVKRGPKYSPDQANMIAKIWLEIVESMKKQGNKLFVVLAHPGRMSPLYLEALDIFLGAISRENSGVNIKTLEEVAASHSLTKSYEV